MVCSVWRKEGAAGMCGREREGELASSTRSPRPFFSSSTQELSGEGLPALGHLHAGRQAYTGGR
jgi:hypothetical protein